MFFDFFKNSLPKDVDIISDYQVLNQFENDD